MRDDAPQGGAPPERKRGPVGSGAAALENTNTSTAHYTTTAPPDAGDFRRLWDFGGYDGPVLWLDEAVGEDGRIAGGAASWIVIEIANDIPSTERDRAIVAAAASRPIYTRDLDNDHRFVGLFARAGERVFVIERMGDAPFPAIGGGA